MKKLYKIIILTVSLILTSCLNEEDIPTINFVLEDSAKLVKYVESKGDFPNSALAPGLILSSEVFSNLNNFWIIDIRPNDVFRQGHIESAISSTPDQLLHIVDSLNLISPTRRIIIVSQNGQSSTYYTCILRIAGFGNVFSLKYGMASWNNDFASEWLQALGTDGVITAYNNEDFPKNEVAILPKINFPPELKIFEEKINFRINNILTDGFYEGETFVRDLAAETIGNSYLVCYGKGRLYNAPLFVPLAKLGHPVNAVLYNTSPLFDFRSAQFLQTLPNNNSIIIYSGDGQLSASIVAYLRFLGYDAKTLLFGANSLFYPRMDGDPELYEDLFSQEDIMNFPYITGN